MSLVICKTPQGIFHILLENALKSPTLSKLIGEPGRIISLPVSSRGLYYVNLYWEGRFDLRTVGRRNLTEIIQAAEFLQLPDLLALCQQYDSDEGEEEERYEISFGVMDRSWLVREGQ